MKKTFKFLGRLVLMVLAFATGASSDVLMANATDLPDAGVIEAGAARSWGRRESFFSFRLHVRWLTV